MNFGMLFLFLLIQMGVNFVLQAMPFIDLTNIYGVMAYYLLSSLIVSFFGALLSTPAGYRKDFYRQPGFHKTMILYFVIFFGLDLIFIL